MPTQSRYLFKRNSNHAPINFVSNDSTATSPHGSKEVTRTKSFAVPGPGKYSRSSSIGHLNHDFTLFKNPAYSIGKAPRILLNDEIQVTPGPGSYSFEQHSNPFKKSIPAFSIGRARRFSTNMF